MLPERHRKGYEALPDPPTFFLDIGAHNGEYSRCVRRLFPDARIFCVEPTLKHDLSDFESIRQPLGESVKLIQFYEATGPHTTGNSRYLEDTAYFRSNHKSMQRIAIPLDSLGLQPDFIKLDVQGSEIDVLRGGLETIKTCKHILCEVSHSQYNVGAPLVDEVVAFLNAHNYEHSETWCSSTIQSDYLFTNRKYNNAGTPAR